MIGVSGEQFDKVCSKQGVQLNKLVAAVLTPKPENRDEYSQLMIEPDGERAALLPTPILGAISGAGDILMGKPGESLADRQMRIPLSFHRDITAVALARVINASVESPIVQPKSAVRFESTNNSTCSCAKAEHLFLETFRALSDITSLGEVALGCQLIVKNDQPIFVRKREGEKTSLTLREIIIDGIPYPAGSIVDTKFRDGDLLIPSSGAEAIPAELIEAVSFLRLSAFALNPLMRQFAFRKMDRSLERPFTRDPDYMRITLKDLGNVAASALASKLDNKIVRPCPAHDVFALS